jgi:hypothetical protein
MVLKSLVYFWNNFDDLFDDKSCIHCFPNIHISVFNNLFTVFSDSVPLLF